MTKYQKVLLFLTRISLGWMLLYAGITKISSDTWSAAGYLNAAKTFPAFYHWLASPEILPLTNFVNEWGQVFLGILLILGLFTRYAAVLGALMMLLYYLPVLSFPYPNPHSFIVDEHIVYALALLFLGASKAGAFLGLDQKIKLLLKR